MNSVRRSLIARSVACSSLLATTGFVSVELLLPASHAQIPAAPAAPAPPPAINSPDYVQFQAAEDLFQKRDFPGAIKGFRAFLEKWKSSSPQSKVVEFHLGIALLQSGEIDEAVEILRKSGSNKAFLPAEQELILSYIPKALALKASKLPALSEPQKEAQKKAFEAAIKEYDAYLQRFPKSKEVDVLLFTRASLLLGSGRVDDAINALKAFVAAPQYINSEVIWDARLLLARAYTMQSVPYLEKAEQNANDLRLIQAAFGSAQPLLMDVFAKSGDLALANDAVFEFANIQITRAGLAATVDEKSRYLNAALDAFRGVRTTEDVTKAQETKIARIEEEQKKINPNLEAARWELFEKASQREREKLEDFKARKDQSLQARLAIVSVFLQLKHSDEARTLLSYAAKLKETESDTEAQKSIAASLAMTYIEQKNQAKAVETYDAFRAKFRGTTEGEALPLMMAAMFLELSQLEMVDKYVDEGMEDYKNWRYMDKAMQVKIGKATMGGSYEEAKAAITKSLEKLQNSENKDAYATTLIMLGNIQQAQAQAEKKPALADEAIATYAKVRATFPDTGHAENAHFATAQILAGKDPAKAIKELKGYLDKYSTGKVLVETKEQREKNLPVALYFLASAQFQTNAKEEAIKSWEALAEKYPNSLPAPDSYFKRHDAYKESEKWEAAVKTMEDFTKKYPRSEKLYYAYSNMAEILMGSGDDAGTEAGTKKLMEFVDYEKGNEVDQRRGDEALNRAAKIWSAKVNKLPPYVAQTNDQKATFQKGGDQVVAAVERLLQQYPKSGLLSAGLEQLANIQKKRTTAKLIEPKAVEAYFDGLASATNDELLKAKISAALAFYLSEKEPKRSFDLLAKIFANLPPSEQVQLNPKTTVPVPTFSPDSYDAYLQGLFNAKRYDDMNKVIPRLAAEYAAGGSVRDNKLVEEAQATGLFWEAKIFGEQGKSKEAGEKFTELKSKYGSSDKVKEANYGIIVAKVDAGQIEPDMTKVLSGIVNEAKTSFELSAKCLFLIARIQEKNGDIDSAIENYVKISVRYAAVPTVAANGLWQGAQLLERQVKGEFKIETPEDKKKRLKEEEAKLESTSKLAEPAKDPKASTAPVPPVPPVPPAPAAAKK